MERLTKWGNGHVFYPRCFKEPCYGSGCKIKDCQFEIAVCERLAAYEDIAELCGGADRLRELAEADKEGRVVVLPCKVGDLFCRISPCNSSARYGGCNLFGIGRRRRRRL